MAETLTAHFGWTKPDPGASTNVWGTELNADLDAIDAQVFTNKQAIAAGGAPVGSVTMFAGPQSKLPVNWLMCLGQSLSTTTYAALFAVVGYKHGGSGANFNLPNLIFRFPLGMNDGENPGGIGGEATHVLTATELASHAHGIVDVAHAHTAQQDAHNHVISTGAHAHAVHTGAHAHSGVVVPGGTFSLGSPGWTTQSGNTSTVGDLGGNTDTVGNLGGSTDTRQPAVGVNPSGTGLTATQGIGSSAPHNNMPPYIFLNFIIRYQ